MKEIKKDNTEEKILVAAQSVFIKKGLDGSRMQEIANEAGINKALLHYYFRTKQKLFEAIFKKVFSQVFPNIQTFAQSEIPFESKLETFIGNYIDILLKNQFIPIFVLKEINRDPDFLTTTFKRLGINPGVIFSMLEQEMETGKLRKIDPRELLVNILALCIFPFAAKPLMQIMLFENNKKSYNDFLIQRKTSVKEFILNSILIK